MYPLVDLIEHQTIAAVHDEKELQLAIDSRVNVIFLMSGSIFNVKQLVDRVLDAGKHVFLHVEFIGGISDDASGIAYIAQMIKPTGIITTKNRLVQAAKAAKLMTIQRIFLIDSGAVTRGLKVAEQSRPDAIEVMPGLMPRVIHEITQATPLPIIVGGLVIAQKEIDDALEAGALAVSVGIPVLW